MDLEAQKRLQNLVFIGAAAVVILAAVVYIFFSASSGNGGRYANVSLGVEPAPTTQIPSKLCFVGAEPIYPQGSGSRITLTAAFLITNHGTQPTDYPASIFLVFNNEVVAEAPLPKSYSPGALLYGGKKDFTFTREFRGLQFTPEKVYRENVDFEYKLVYCATPCDPLREGKVIYVNSTRYCCRLPSTGVPGGFPSSCG
jgi:hypothetical protein